MHVHPARNLMGFHNVILHDGLMEYSKNNNVLAKDHWETTDDYLPWLRERLGFDADISDLGLDANSWVARAWMYPEHLHPTNWVVNQSIDFLRKKDPTKPFFLKMSFVRPHSPLDPPHAYFDQYINQAIPLPPVGDWVDNETLQARGIHVNTFKGIINERALKKGPSRLLCFHHSPGSPNRPVFNLPAGK